MPARYVAVLDAGSTFLKLSLFSQDQTSQQPQLCASWIQPRLLFESSLQNLLAQAKTWLANADPKASYELAVVGHYPETTILSEVKWKITHEDALLAVAKCLSANATIVVIDIGSQRTLVAMGKMGKVSLESFDQGVGLEAWNKVRRTDGLSSVRQWMTLDVANGLVENYLANKSLFSEIIPSSNEELMIEQSMARAILIDVSQKLTFPWHEVESIIVTGATLTQTAVAAQTAGMILDGLAPLGTVQLLSDQNLVVMAAGGALEAWAIDDVRQGRSLIQKQLQPIGTMVSLNAPTNGSQRLAKVTLDIGLDQNQVLEVKSGDLLSLPLPAEDQGTLSIVSDHSQVRKQAGEQVAVGGQAGLIIDGRGRPLVLSANDGQRRAQLLQWDRQINAHHQYGSIGEEA